MADLFSGPTMTVPRILFVQFAGDFRAAQRLLERSGTETYYGHRYVLDQLARLQVEQGPTAILCCLSGERYAEQIATGVTVMGANAHPERESHVVIAMMEAFQPTHIVVLTPMPKLLRWARRSGARMLCVFADSFNAGALHRWWRFGRLEAQLNDPRVEWVANHGRNACRSLERIGVNPAKVVPWDWPQRRRPDDLPSKDQAPCGIPTLFFAGEIIALKGVGDVIAATAALKARGREVRLQIAGRGRVDEFRAMAAKLGVAAQVDFLGVVPNDAVLDHMRAAAAVVVPSRHRYPEGLPLTIYEALCSRTPLITSDHPMFVGNVVDGESALIYPAGRPKELADAVARLLDDDGLYARLSANGAEAWRRIQIPLQWGELMYHWVRDGEEDRALIASHRI